MIIPLVHFPPAQTALLPFKEIIIYQMFYPFAYVLVCAEWVYAETKSHWGFS